jgi:hypothetical protein
VCLLAETAREYIDSLFNFALVFLALLSSAEFEYALSTSKIQTEWTYVLRISITPFLVLIPLWISKEALKSHMSRRMRMGITEFCWGYWANSLVYFLLVFMSTQNPNPSLMSYDLYLSFALASLLFIAIQYGYYMTYKRGPYKDMIEFYSNQPFIMYRSLLFIASYITVIFTVLPKL